MGIQGLLPFLKKIHSPVNISQYEGCTAAIDAYCWLHRGAFACAEKLALGEKTDQYVFYCMKYINYLLSKNIKPIMVLDGCHLPSKKEVETSRRERRDINRKKAAQFLREGKRSEARDCLQKCIDVTPQMALELMNACRARNVDCIVAPYEADAQLAYLSLTGIAQLVITEDSDLILFGCERIIFKMDHFGNGTLIEKRRLNEVLSLKNGFYSFDKFRYMCILSGCDYLPSLPGIGLAKANKVFKYTQQSDVRMVLKKLPTYITLSEPVTTDYIEAFIRADNTFLYQLVFDPLSTQVVPLTPYMAGLSVDDMAYAGSHKPRQLSVQIALGNIDIYTQNKMADFDPKRDLKQKCDGLPSHQLSIWHPRYRPMTTLPLKETQVKGHGSTEGREVTVDTKSLIKCVRTKRQSSDVENEVGIQDSRLSDIYTGIDSPKKRPRLTRQSEDTPDFSQEIHKSTTDTSPIRTPVVTSLNHTPTRTANTNDNVAPSRDPSPASCNRFAVTSPETKEKFHVNAVKVEVKSRFFAKRSRPSSLIDSLSGLDRDGEVVTSGEIVSSGEVTGVLCNDNGETNIVDMKVEVDEDVSEGLIEARDEESNVQIRRSCVVKCEKYTENITSTSPSNGWNKTTGSNQESTLKSTPKSSFSWSKFTFLKKSSEDETSENSKSSPAHLPFRIVSPLHSNSKLSGFFSKSSSCGSNRATSLESPRRVDEPSRESERLCESQPDSISGDTQPSTENSDVIDLSQDDATMSSSFPRSKSQTLKMATLSQPSHSLHNKKPAPRGAHCRVSGLRSAPSKQTSVRDMLVKFASSSSNRLTNSQNDKDSSNESDLSPFFRQEQSDLM